MDYEQLEVEKIIDYLEENLRNSNFEAVDTWLNTSIVSELTDAGIIAALTISYWGKEKLTQREDFLSRAEPILKERLGEERAEKLLRFRR